ncbi:MAG: type II secretion system protein, partial [Planctomycetota bacterium]
MRKKAFTLVELLVVIAIISVLAGLLLPALEGALDATQQVSCSSQMRQLYLGCVTYADGNEGILGNHHTGRPAGGWQAPPNTIYHKGWGAAPGGIFGPGAWLLGGDVHTDLFFCPGRNHEVSTDTSRYLLHSELQTVWQEGPAQEYFASGGGSGVA